MIGPKVGEKWIVGSYTGLIFLGIGKSFEQDKYFIFKDGNGMFVIDKDNFYATDLYKKLET